MALPLCRPIDVAHFRKIFFSAHPHHAFGAIPTQRKLEENTLLAHRHRHCGAHRRPRVVGHHQALGGAPSTLPQSPMTSAGACGERLSRRQIRLRVEPRCQYVWHCRLCGNGDAQSICLALPAFVGGNRELQPHLFGRALSRRYFGRYARGLWCGMACGISLEKDTKSVPNPGYAHHLLPNRCEVAKPCSGYKFGANYRHCGGANPILSHFSKNIGANILKLAIFVIIL